MESEFLCLLFMFLFVLDFIIKDGRVLYWNKWDLIEIVWYLLMEERYKYLFSIVYYMEFMCDICGVIEFLLWICEVYSIIVYIVIF